MEGIAILAIIGSAIGFLAYRARGKAGARDLASDARGAAALPRRPVSGGDHVGQLGNDLIEPGDAGAQPRL